MAAESPGTDRPAVTQAQAPQAQAPQARPAGRRRPAGTTPRTRRERGVALSAELIVERALEVTEREGAASLTMRRLGEVLGVDPTAVYRHFRDKDDLVLACMDRIIDNDYAALRPGLDLSDWRAVLRAAAQGSWQSCEAHPAIYSLAFHRTTGGPGERKMVELLLTTLASTGLSPEQTVLYFRVFVDSMLAMCGMKAGGLSLDRHLQEKDRSAWTRIYAILPQEEYPHARAHATHLAEVTEQSIFTAVTDSVISLIDAAIGDAARP